VEFIASSIHPVPASGVAAHINTAGATVVRLIFQFEKFSLFFVKFGQ